MDPPENVRIHLKLLISAGEVMRAAGTTQQVSNSSQEKLPVPDNSACVLEMPNE